MSGYWFSGSGFFVTFVKHMCLYIKDTHTNPLYLIFGDYFTDLHGHPVMQHSNLTLILILTPQNNLSLSSDLQNVPLKDTVYPKQCYFPPKNMSLQTYVSIRIYTHMHKWGFPSPKKYCSGLVPVRTLRPASALWSLSEMTLTCSITATLRWRLEKQLRSFFGR